MNVALNKKATLGLLISAIFPLSVYGAVGKMEFVTGEVSAVNTNGQARPISKGSEIETGDTLKTLDGRAQIRFSDGGFISLQPYTDFQVEDYSFNGKADGSEKGLFKLLKGGMRAVTGLIGKTNKDAYKVSTPTATIGIRGTSYLARLFQLASGSYKLNVHCGQGAVVLQNQGGMLVLYRGQNGSVTGPTQAPKQTTETPSVTAASPTSGVGDETTQQTSSPNTYVDGNVRFSSTSLCQTGGSSCAETITSSSSASSSTDINTLLSGGLANIPSLNALNAVALYTGTSSLTIGGSTASVENKMIIEFSDYLAFFDADGTFNNAGIYANQSLDAEIDGSLNPATGALTFDTNTSSGSTIGSTPVTMTASGNLNSSRLSVATVLYGISDGSNSGSATVTMNGSEFTFDDPFEAANALLQGGLSNISSLASLGAIASYTGSSSFTLQGSTANVTDIMSINFSDLSTTFAITGVFDSAGMYATSPIGASASGTLNSATGNITFTNSSSIITNTLSNNVAITFSASGALNSSNLSQANITYGVDDAVSPQSTTTSLSGTVVSTTLSSGM